MRAREIFLGNFIVSLVSRVLRKIVRRERRGAFDTASCSFSNLSIRIRSTPNTMPGSRARGESFKSNAQDKIARAQAETVTLRFPLLIKIVFPPRKREKTPPPPVGHLRDRSRLRNLRLKVQLAGYSTARSTVPINQLSN